jgi:hypothetical protein
MKSRRKRWARNGEKGKANRILMWRPEGKRPLGRPRRRWVDDAKLDLREIGWDDMDWIHLAYDREQWRAFVNTVINLGLHKILGNSWVAERLEASQEDLNSMQLVSSCYVVLCCVVLRGGITTSRLLSTQTSTGPLVPPP